MASTTCELRSSKKKSLATEIWSPVFKLEIVFSEMHQPKTRWSKGFTLIEVVIALAILGIGLTVIIELFSGGLRLARISEEYTKAMNLGRMKMEEITYQQKIEEGTNEGDFDDTFHWQVTIKKTDLLPVEKDSDFKPPVELFGVRVDILWNSGSKQRSASVESYKAIKPEEGEK